MKRTAVMVTIMLIFVGLAVTLNVLAKQIDTEFDAQLKTINEQPQKNDHWANRAKQLETLKANLSLNAIQETAWNEWLDTNKSDHQAWQTQHKNDESWASLSVPERMEKKLAYSKAYIIKQEARWVATKKFYDTLTHEQRKTFDKEYVFNHPHHEGTHLKQNERVL